MTKGNDERDGQVYRMYDAWSNPLYYGSSRSVFGRIHSHTYGREWFPEVAMILVDRYPSRLVAQAVEHDLIERDEPWFNDEGVTRPWSGPRVAPEFMPPLPPVVTVIPGGPTRQAERPLPEVPPAEVADILRADPLTAPERSALLADLRRVFDGVDKLSTGEVIARLLALPGSDWAERWPNANTAPRYLAAALAPLGVAPRPMQLGPERIKRGYRHRDLAPLWLTG